MVALAVPFELVEEVNEFDCISHSLVECFVEGERDASVSSLLAFDEVLLVFIILATDNDCVCVGVQHLRRRPRVWASGKAARGLHCMIVEA